MKNKILLIALFILSQTILVHAQLQVTDNNTVKLGGKKTDIYLGKINKYGGNSGHTFNTTNPTAIGLILENGIDDANAYDPTEESAGIYIDCDYITLWSPGDGGTNEKGTSGYLLKVYDEDGWQLRWFLDGVGTAFQNSDSTRKENIEPIYSSLSKIKEMRSVRYDFIKTDTEKSKQEGSDSQTTSIASEDGKCIGFIAQEMEKILPELVRTDETGAKFVNYTGIIPVAVQAIQEQQQLIDSLKEQLDAQMQQINLLKSDLVTLKQSIEELKVKK